MSNFKNTLNGSPKRYNWLIKKINKKDYKIGAEIGCMKGNTSVRLMRKCPQLHLICVDLWEHDYNVLSDYCKEVYREWDFNRIKNSFDQQMKPYKGRYTEIKGISWEMADKVKDNSLDFIFIDADHAYESVKKDILAWTPKLKPKGLLSGHDINILGVKKAVKETAPNFNKAGVDNVWFCRKEDVII